MNPDGSPGAPGPSWAGVSARRLERQYLTAPRAAGSPADAAAAMCGAHAQVLTAAEWSIGLRLAGVTQDDVRRAVWAEHSLVKTFGPRGTVHLLPARDLPMWTAALSAVPVTFRTMAGVRLTPGQAEEVIAAIGAVLLGAELTIDELSDEVVARTGRWAGELAAPRQWAAEAFGAMAGDLQQVELDGSPAWLLAGDTVFPPAAPPGVRLLPYFDAYPVAGQPRALLYPGRAASGRFRAPARRAPSRSCSSVGWCRGYGISAGPAGSLMSPSSPLAP